MPSVLKNKNNVILFGQIKAVYFGNASEAGELYFKWVLGVGMKSSEVGTNN